MAAVGGVPAARVQPQHVVGEMLRALNAAGDRTYLQVLGLQEPTEDAAVALRACSRRFQLSEDSDRDAFVRMLALFQSGQLGSVLLDDERDLVLPTSAAADGPAAS